MAVCFAAFSNFSIRIFTIAGILVQTIEKNDETQEMIDSYPNSYFLNECDASKKEDLEKIGINLWIFNRTPKEFYQDYVYTGTYDLCIWSMYIFSIDELNSSFSSNKIPSMETEENKNCENFYWYANKNIDNLYIIKEVT